MASNIYLLGAINEYLTFDESDKFEIFTQYDLDFGDYNHFQRKKKREKERYVENLPEKEAEFRRLLLKGEKDAIIFGVALSKSNFHFIFLSLLGKYGLYKQLKEIADIEITQVGITQILYVAARYGYLEIVISMLEKHDVDIIETNISNVQKQYVGTDIYKALKIATENGQLEIVKE